jgi:hypothetical protein
LLPSQSETQVQKSEPHIWEFVWMCDRQWPIGSICESACSQ